MRNKQCVCKDHSLYCSSQERTPSLRCRSYFVPRNSYQGLLLKGRVDHQVSYICTTCLGYGQRYYSEHSGASGSTKGSMVVVSNDDVADDVADGIGDVILDGIGDVVGDDIGDDIVDGIADDIADNIVIIKGFHGFDEYSTEVSACSRLVNYDIFTKISHIISPNKFPH